MSRYTLAQPKLAVGLGMLNTSDQYPWRVLVIADQRSHWTQGFRPMWKVS